MTCLRQWGTTYLRHLQTSSKRISAAGGQFLPRDALYCKARSCDRMSSVCLSVWKLDVQGGRGNVRLSLTLVDCDHIGWNSSDIISPFVSLGCSLSADPNIRGLLQGEHREILAQSDPPPVDLSVGDIRSQIAAEWLQIVQRSQWRAYRKPPSLFRMVPSLTPMTPPSPKWGFHMLPIYTNDHISATAHSIHLYSAYRSSLR